MGAQSRGTFALARLARASIASRLSWLAIVAYLGLGAGMLLFVLLVIAPNDRREVLDRWRTRLSVLADDRKDAIDIWLGSCIGDARAIAVFRSGLALADPGLASKEITANRDIYAHLTTLLSQTAIAQGHLAAYLTDASGNPLAASDGAEALDLGCQALGRVAASGHTTPIDFHRHGSRAVVAVAAPVVDPRQPNGPFVGAIVLVADPARWLYPFLERVGRQTASGEAVLMRAERLDALYFSPLRYRPDPPLTFRRLLTEPKLAAAEALKGREGFAQLEDYRGVTVLAATRKLHRAPWGLVVKVDEDEAFAGHRAWVGQVLAIAGLLWLLVGSVVAVFGRTMHVADLRVLAASERQQHETVRRLNAELEQRVLLRTAELNATNNELEAFSYSVSHDLRAPLRAIDGFSRLLLEEHAASLNSEGQRLLGVVREQAQRMGRLIDDLLAFSRIGRHQLDRTVIDMTALAQSTFAELTTPVERESIALVVHPMPPAWGDLTMVRQLWVNLLANAVKFTTDKPERRIEVGASADERGPVYWVKDNGAGFDMRYKDKLFGVFQRLHSTTEFPGTGIGLALVKRIVDRHGGRVWAEGVPGQGATFFWTLPMQEETTCKIQKP